MVGLVFALYLAHTLFGARKGIMMKFQQKLRAQCLHLVVLLGLLWCVASAQLPTPTHDEDKPKTVFHVTSVVSGEAPSPWCETGECTATLITVKGYTRAQRTGSSTQGVQYVLSCIDVTRLTPPKGTLVCPRLHANKDYSVTIFAASVAFFTTGSGNETWVDYDIISEQETDQKNR